MLLDNISSSMFSPAQMTLPIKLGPRLWEILHLSPAPPQFSWTTSEKSFNLQGSLSPSVILIPSLLEVMPGCWMCERCLVFAVEQDAEIIVTWTYQGFAGETRLCLHLAWKLLNRMRLSKFWVQKWMAKCFSSSSPLCIPQGSILHFPELFPDVYKNSMKYKIDTAKLAVQLPLKTILKFCHIRNSQQDKITETLKKIFLFSLPLRGMPLSQILNISGSGRLGLEIYRKEKSCPLGYKVQTSLLIGYLLGLKLKQNISDDF